MGPLHKKPPSSPELPTPGPDWHHLISNSNSKNKTTPIMWSHECNSLSSTNFWLTIQSVVVFAGILGVQMFWERVEPDPTLPWSRHRKVTEIVTFAAQQTRKVCYRLEVCEHSRKAGQAKHSISFRHSQDACSYLKFLLQLTKIISWEVLQLCDVAQFFL